MPMDYIVNLNDADTQLRHALNELRALDACEDIPSDRKTCATRLRALAEYIENKGIPPSAVSIIHEASSIPIQR